MKKISYILVTLLSLTGLITCLVLKGNYYEFNSSNVKNNIAYLSSSEFKGRLPGSEENYRTCDEISQLFEEYNLKPISENYKEGFNTMTPIYNNEQCSLKLLNGDIVIKEFVLGEDFKEDMLNFKNPSIQFTYKDTIQIYKRAISITKGNTEYLFCVNLDKGFPFRSSFMSDSDIGFAIQINTATFNAILDGLRDGYTLDVNLPYSVKQKEIFNVVGKIEGRSKDLPPLILTAHYDHVGVDTLGSIYYGALDNASGTSFILELARSFSTLKAPERDIIFVALNGEEFGLLGSNEFAKKHKDEFAGAEVINFDMIGAADYPITLMTGEKSKDIPSSLLYSLVDICTEKNTDYNITYQDASDHASFIKNGFDSLTVSHSDVSNIHTPRDTYEHISCEAIDSVYDVINCKVIDSAYNDKLLIFYNSKTIIFFTLSSFLLILVGIIKAKKAKENTDNNISI